MDIDVIIVFICTVVALIVVSLPNGRKAMAASVKQTYLMPPLRRITGRPAPDRRVIARMEAELDRAENQASPVKSGGTVTVIYTSGAMPLMSNGGGGFSGDASVTPHPPGGNGGATVGEISYRLHPHGKDESCSPMCLGRPDLSGGNGGR